MGTADQIYYGVGFFDLFCHVLLLHHTAAQDDYLPGLRFLCMVKGSHIAEYAHFRVLAYGAGVYDYYVGLKLVLCEGAAHFGQIAAYTLAVAFVLLAAVCVHKSQHLSAGAHEMQPELFTNVVLTGYFLFGYLFSFVRHKYIFPNRPRRVRQRKIYIYTGAGRQAKTACAAGAVLCEEPPRFRALCGIHYLPQKHG